MIGYTLTATGSSAASGFGYYDSGWSDGDIWLDEVSLGPGGPYVYMGHGGYHQALVEAMYGTLDKFKELKLDLIASKRCNFRLKVSGSFNFIYLFDSNKPAERTQFELVESIKSCRTDMGDTVMLSLCKCIIAFQDVCITYTENNEVITTNELNVHIEI